MGDFWKSFSYAEILRWETIGIWYIKYTTVEKASNQNFEGRDAWARSISWFQLYDDVFFQ